MASAMLMVLGCLSVTVGADTIVVPTPAYPAYSANVTWAVADGSPLGFTGIIGIGQTTAPPEGYTNLLQLDFITKSVWLDEYVFTTTVYEDSTRAVTLGSASAGITFTDSNPVIIAVDFGSGVSVPESYYVEIQAACGPGGHAWGLYPYQWQPLDILPGGSGLLRNHDGSTTGMSYPTSNDWYMAFTYEVPEPATLSLMGVGVLVGLIRRKK